MAPPTQPVDANALARVEGKLNRFEQDNKELRVKLDTHLNDKAPHNLTKEHVGLDMVVNLGIAAIGANVEGLATAEDVYAFSLANFLPKDDIFPFSSVVLGQETGFYGGNLGKSVLIGARAGRGAVSEFKDFVTIGADTHPIASHTVQLGHSGDTFVSAKDVVARSDARDFKEVKDLDLGLEFVLLLKPRLAKMDLREDYVDYDTMPMPPADRPLPPKTPRTDEKNPINLREWQAYRDAIKHWQIHVDAPYQEALAKWRNDYRVWRSKNNLSYIEADGSKMHEHVQAVLLADEVANAANILKTEFSGIVDFKLLEGLDVKGMRTAEMVPVLVNAIKQLHEYVHSDGFIDRMVDRMLKKGQRGREALRHAATIVKNDQREAEHEAALAAEASSTPTDSNHSA
jgi:hypothetical protein